MSTSLNDFIVARGFADLRDLVNGSSLTVIRSARTVATDSVDIALLDKVITNETESREMNTRMHAAAAERNRLSRNANSRTNR
jgi:hypothetical protein